MFVPSIPRDQEWSPSQRGSTSCSPPATTSISPPACPRDDSCRGRTTGGPSWTARGSEDTPASSPHLCVCVCARSEEELVSGCQNLLFEKEKGKKKKEKKRRERLVISQIHNYIQGRFTKQTLVALCWERTSTCLTTRGRSETEGEDVDNLHLHHFYCKTVTAQQLTTRTKWRADWTFC